MRLCGLLADCPRIGQNYILSDTACPPLIPYTESPRRCTFCYTVRYPREVVVCLSTFFCEATKAFPWLFLPCRLTGMTRIP